MRFLSTTGFLACAAILGGALGACSGSDASLGSGGDAGSHPSSGGSSGSSSGGASSSGAGSGSGSSGGAGSSGAASSSGGTAASSGSSGGTATSSSSGGTPSTSSSGGSSSSGGQTSSSGSSGGGSDAGGCTQATDCKGALPQILRAMRGRHLRLRTLGMPERRLRRHALSARRSGRRPGAVRDGRVFLGGALLQPLHQQLPQRGLERRLPGRQRPRDRLYGHGVRRKRRVVSELRVLLRSPLLREQRSRGEPGHVLGGVPGAVSANDPRSARRRS